MFTKPIIVGISTNIMVLYELPQQTERYSSLLLQMGSRESPRSYDDVKVRTVQASRRTRHEGGGGRR